MKTVLDTSFSGGFIAHNGDSHLTVPAGWTPVWKHDPREGHFDQPEYKPKQQESEAHQIRTPPKSASWGTAFATHRAALMIRLVGVEAGQRIQASAWAMTITRDKDGNVGSNCGEVIGIGSTTDLEAAEYGQWWSADDPDWREGEWAAIDYEGTAPSDGPYLFLRGDANYRLKSNYHIFDDVLVLVEDTEPPPEPPPGDLARRIEAVAAKLDINIASLALCRDELYTIAAQVNGCPARVTELAENMHRDSTELLSIV